MIPLLKPVAYAAVSIIPPHPDNKFATIEKKAMSENTRKIVEDLLLNVLHGNSVEN